VRRKHRQSEKKRRDGKKKAENEAEQRRKIGKREKERKESYNR
jgi:hypothetical protein